MPERVERISNKKCGESPVDFSHIFYGPVQGCLLADKLFLFTGTISLKTESGFPLSVKRVRQLVLTAEQAQLARPVS